MFPKPQTIGEIRYGVKVTTAPKYKFHQPKDQEKSPCFLVQYAVAYFEREGKKSPVYACKFVQFETEGQALEIAKTWWKTNTGNSNTPKTVQEAVNRVDEIQRPDFVVYRIRESLFHEVLEERLPESKEQIE